MALVTGAGSGIGAATALALAERGATVLCADLDGRTAEKVAAACGASESVFERMVALDGAVDLEPGLRHLVKLRASQINGCAYCVEMHSREAAAEGEAPHRLHGLAAWEEVDWYSDRERAALALTEAMTRLADGPVSDAVFDTARAHFDDEELAQLMWAVVAINAWNRVAVTVRTPPAGPS